MIYLKSKVQFQRDYRIQENETISNFIVRYEGEELNPNDAIAVISVDGVPFELNMTAAIILEELLNQKSFDEVASLLKSLFGVDEHIALSAIGKLVKDLKEKGVIECNESN